MSEPSLTRSFTNRITSTRCTTASFWMIWRRRCLRHPTGWSRLGTRGRAARARAKAACDPWRCFGIRRRKRTEGASPWRPEIERCGRGVRKSAFQKRTRGGSCGSASSTKLPAPPSPTPSPRTSPIWTPRTLSASRVSPGTSETAVQHHGVIRLLSLVIPIPTCSNLAIRLRRRHQNPHQDDDHDNCRPARCWVEYLSSSRRRVNQTLRKRLSSPFRELYRCAARSWTVDSEDLRREDAAATFEDFRVEGRSLILQKTHAPKEKQRSRHGIGRAGEGEGHD
mmetsp:Transcript_15054/g.45564  ORF Transcript_15054/g.45564 Transcript_15054/m.45564 type:complete len:281 (+) Transcript_15054:155-997(+)